MAMSLRLMADNGYSNPGVDEAMKLVASWQDPERTPLREALETALMKRDLGVSTKTLLTELGYENVEDEIAAAADEADSRADRALRMVNRGQLPGEETA